MIYKLTSEGAVGEMLYDYIFLNKNEIINT